MIVSGLFSYQHPTQTKKPRQGAGHFQRVSVRSDREVFRAQLCVFKHFGGRAVEYDSPRIKDDRTIRQLQRTQGQYALCTMCVGVGQGVAVIFENLQ